MDEYAPRSLPYNDIRQKEPERIAERPDEEASVSPEIGEKGKEHPIARQSEATRYIEEEEERENAHPHIHGQECPLRRRQPSRFQEQHGQQETDEHAHEIAEDEVLELLDRRQVDPAHPDQQQFRKKNMGEQF